MTEAELIRRLWRLAYKLDSGLREDFGEDSITFEEFQKETLADEDFNAPLESPHLPIS